MNGAQSLVQTAVASGIEVCFANPGTTEVTLMAALDAMCGIKPVLCLTEGVCAGAADGFGRMRDWPALTLTHLGPGFANAIAQVHNARRAHSPVVNIIGQQATWHVAGGSVLDMDVEGLARSVSDWTCSSGQAATLGDDLRQAIESAAGQPGQVATLIVPADCQWEEGGRVELARAVRKLRSPNPANIEAVAARLRDSSRVLLLLGGAALREAPLRLAGEVAARSGARLFCETFPARAERGRGRPLLTRLPYFPEQAQPILASASDLVLVGTREPVATFGYAGGPRRLVPPNVAVHSLASAEENPERALAALLELLPKRSPVTRDEPAPPPCPSGALDVHSFGGVLAACQPDHAIVVDESATSGGPYALLSHGAKPFSHLNLTGGAIGFGLPCALGAALACPERPVLALQADGGGLYSTSALWSLAREGANVTVVVCANQAYRILRMETSRAGHRLGHASTTLTDLSTPRVDWVALARSLGVPAERVEDATDLAGRLETAFEEPGPHLIEVPL